MRLSYKYNFLYISVPRTASRSMRKLLDDHSEYKSVHIANVTKKNPFYHHIPAKDVSNLLEKKQWGKLFKFAVVRNPYDKVVSLFYHYNYHRRQQQKKELTFEEHITQLGSHKILSRDFYYFAGSNNKLLLDKIYKFEDMKIWVPEICERLQIEKSNIEELGILKRQKEQYQDYYSNKTRHIVSKLYAKEIDVFNYIF